VDYREHHVHTVNGSLRHRRAYYHCSHCQQGHCPADADLGLEAHWSPTLLPVVTLLGVVAPFAQATDILHKVTGLRFAPETCRRRTEAVGAQLQERHQHQQVVSLPKAPDWDFSLPDRDGQHFAGTVAYLGLDAFAVPTRGRSGVDWKMLYVGLLYDPGKGHTLYLVDYDFEQLAGTLRRYAVALGVGQAETLVALTDGGNGLERVLRQGVSGAVEFVLDWWHLSQKLHEVGGLIHEQDTGAAAAWARAREATLWDQGGAALVAEMDRLGCPATASTAAQERWTEVRTHVWKNRHRTAYPEYRAHGWDVGSGPTEAGCKVMAGRVKGTGMRWEKSASQSVAALKALYASGMGLWEAFWAQRQAPADYLQK
jgi:hypothetical protein